MPAILVSEQQIGHVAATTWREVSTFFESDCCVLATRVLLDVLGDLGVPAFPLAVVAAFYDPPVARHIEQHGCTAWGACGTDLDEIGGHVVILGMPPNQRRPMPEDPRVPVQGHVAVIARERLLIDLTVSQASHPELGLPIDDILIAPINARFWRGQAEMSAQVEGGMGVRYRPFPHDRWYTVNSPDWHANPISEELRAAVHARLRGEEPIYSEHTRLVHLAMGRI